MPKFLSESVRCIEAGRGLDQEGLYRVPGSSKEVKALMERWRSGTGVQGGAWAYLGSGGGAGGGWGGAGGTQLATNKKCRNTTPQ